MADLISMLAAAAGQAGEYEIERSLRFNSADSAYLSRTPASASNQKTWTWSAWVKRATLGSQEYIFFAGPDGNNRLGIRWNNDNLEVEGQNSSVEVIKLVTSAVYRDVSAWYHIVVAVDTTQATSSNRAKVYVNGTQVTALGTATYPSQNTDLYVNSANIHAFGRYNPGSSNYYNGYLTEIHFIDGQALTPSSFGQIDSATGVWEPKAYTGTYGTNGFYLPFSDNTSTTTLGYDAAGSNDWTLNNFSVTAGAGNDSLVDSPTRYGTDTGAGGEVRGNYATLNPVDQAGGLLFAEGNLKVTANTGWDGSRATFSYPSTGKWYWEATCIARSTGASVGILGTSAAILGDLANAATGYVYNSGDGNKYNNGGNAAYGATWGANDIIGIAWNSDTGTLSFYKNGVSQGDAYTGLTGQFSPALNVNGSDSMLANFGQRAWAHTPPSGFKALCTTNLPDPTIVEGDDYFNTVLYTGTGSSQSITGVGFQPDFVWIKERSGAADHGLYDAVRGVQQQLESNTTTDETTESTGLTAFGTDGFTVGSLAQLNTNTDTYVAWNWKESTTSKFDIVTYTGNGTARTISHNLGVVPNMIIVKARTTASTDQGWPVYHSANTANPETDYLLLNSTAATADLDTVWNDTAPTSSVFSVGTNALVNANNDTYVAYLFANVAGFSAFGSYTGNGSTDGPFVYTGFRPRWIMVKVSSTTADWVIVDAARIGYNINNKFLFPNGTFAESASGVSFDILSNGFKVRNTNAEINSNAATYIYAAFAESPFKTSLAR